MVYLGSDVADRLLLLSLVMGLACTTLLLLNPPQLSPAAAQPYLSHLSPELFAE
jgi:hypothetical protein